MLRYFGAAFVGLMTVCAPSLAFADDACRVAWTSDVQPLVNSLCVACHQDAAPAGDLSLQRGSAPENLIGVLSGESEMAYIAPGLPQESYLFRKLEGTHVEAGGSGERMPLGGELTDTDLAIIESWILGCERA